MDNLKNVIPYNLYGINGTNSQIRNCSKIWATLGFFVHIWRSMTDQKFPG